MVSVIAECVNQQTSPVGTAIFCIVPLCLMLILIIQTPKLMD